ncbi:TetR/AcrR family transcriptional regulator [Actinokineospora soli]|uniref:TetR/AcrR family transcriptional regulator n=1 Tax=Actinokineospora soli TaxID=1048753 RepID=A0ABW2TSK8_9PSEU
MGQPGKTPREYRSPLRAEKARRTREVVLAAAREVFLRDGYARTTMRAVATAAGVSVQSVEQHFGTKRGLLKTVVDVAMAGDDEPVGVADRDWVLRARAARDFDEMLAITTAGVTEIGGRLSDVAAVVHGAADADEEIAALARVLDEQRMVGARMIVAGLSTRRPPRVDDGTAADTLWLLMDPVVYRRLTRDRGWTPDAYGRWFADAVRRLVF